MPTARLVIASFILALFVLIRPVGATLSSCGASVTPTTMTPSSSATFTFAINNTGSSAIAFVRITRPSDNFTITSYDASGWSGSASSSDATFTGGSVSVGGTSQFLVIARSGSSTADAASWTVSASDASDGSGAIGCTGSLGTSISGSAPDTTAPEISSITVSGITNSQAVITWTTNEAATSVVEYGTTDALGSTKSDPQMLTSHSVTLTDLSTNTTYYYSVSSADASGNTTSSDTATITTASVTSAGTATTTTSTTTSTTTTVTKVVAPPKDTTPPSVSLTTDFSRAFEKAPEIVGKASDPSRVVKVEYSVDNGQNWLPVDLVDNLGAKTVNFSFVPPAFDDGNYEILARAIDGAENTGRSKVATLVIDRLPPAVGGVVYSLGPIVLMPDSLGRISALPNLNMKITLSAVGGPTILDLLTGQQTTSLAKNPDNGLWSGTINLEKEGEYQPSVRGVDGAKNETVRNLNKVLVLPGGRVEGRGKAATGAIVKVFSYDPISGRFVLWDGTPYGQDNPQKVADDGGYALFLPPGKYYLEAEAGGFAKARSQIFTLAQPSPINTKFSLEPRSWWWWKTSEVWVAPPAVGSGAGKSELVGKEAPTMEFASRGKPTLLTFLTTWLPQSAEQIAALSGLSKEFPQVSFVVIGEQEPKNKLEIYKKRGGYNLTMVADPDGKLVEPLGLTVLPTHLFLDRRGTITQVETGVLSTDQIRDLIL